MASPYKSNEVPMVYLNKGQFYPITLHGVDSSVCLNVTKVKVSLDIWGLMVKDSLYSSHSCIYKGHQLHQFFVCDQASPSQISVPPLAPAKKH